MKTVAISNHKGGVGKTATTQNLGAVLAADHGQRVLLVDADPQASLTENCGIHDAAGKSLAEVIGGAEPGRVSLRSILRPVSEGLFIAPADIALSVSELGLVARMGREMVLKRALAAVGPDFDVCLIDTPTSLGLLTVNALTVADGVLVPTIPQITDLRALRLFLDTLDRIRENLNPDLAVIGILPTFYDSRLTHHQQGLQLMQSAGLSVLPVQIGRSVRVADAAAAHQPVTTYEPRNPQAAAYKELGRLVHQWLSKS